MQNEHAEKCGWNALERRERNASGDAIILTRFLLKYWVEAALWRDNLLLFSYFAFADKNKKANVEIIYSLVLTSLSRKQPVDLLSVNLFVKSLLYLVFGV